jgi:hypothetical protein
MGGQLCQIWVNTNISQTEWASKVLDFNHILMWLIFKEYFSVFAM